MSKRLMVMALVAASLSACSSNTVKVINSDKQPIDADSARFTNLYPGEKQYPITCKSGCYEPTRELVCNDEQCTYTGQYAQSEYSNDFIIQWMGHAQFSIVTPSGERLLTDPVFNEFDWPINWLHGMFKGDYREAYPDIDQSEIEAVDGVLYSHVHYDHFNKADIKQLGSGAAYYVPLDVARHFPEIGADIFELGWFTQAKSGETTVHAVPAHHFSSRTFIPFIYDDTNRASWNGWLLRSNDKTLFFAGDTGYSKHFKDIYDDFGDIDVCLLPIASYHSDESPKWYRYVHMTPEDAITAAKNLNCKTVIPWGYGNASWEMGDKSSHAPLLRFLTMVKRIKPDFEIVILDERTYQN